MTKDDEIRKLAYNIYKKRIEQHGSEIGDWLKAENAFIWKERLFKFLRHPILLLIISGIAIWLIQQNYLKQEKLIEKKYDVIKIVAPIQSSYYQEIWNLWYAFQNKSSSEKYRANLQQIVNQAKSVEIQLPILFRDKIIYKDWRDFMRIYWEAQYPIYREGISEKQLNEKLNLATPLLNDILERMLKEIK